MGEVTDESYVVGLTEREVEFWEVSEGEVTPISGHKCSQMSRKHWRKEVLWEGTTEGV